MKNHLNKSEEICSHCNEQAMELSKNKDMGRGEYCNQCRMMFDHYVNDKIAEAKDE